MVRPDGVDICSGVRRHGKLDLALLSAFMEEVRKASA
jgi:phosphoribosylanthranilate isomerase